jgi:excisionase family DNA binding protein
MPATQQLSTVVVPESTEHQGTAEVAQFLEFCQARSADLHLVAADGTSVPLPSQVVTLLSQLASTLLAGEGVAINPIAKEMTTGEAAAMLGMSRPTLIKLLDADRIPSHRIGTHRRVLLRDVLAFRRQRLLERRKSYEALMEECDALGIDQ